LNVVNRFFLITYFIKYKLDDVYILYNIVSMFVNDVVCDRDIVYSRKEIFVFRLIRMCIIGGVV